MKIAILVEGATEVAFKEKLLDFLQNHLQGNMPKLWFIPQKGLIPTGNKLKRVVENLLQTATCDAVIALTDVYTGKPDFVDSKDAKHKMRSWVGGNPRFYPCVASHDFEGYCRADQYGHLHGKPGSQQ